MLKKQLSILNRDLPRIEESNYSERMILFSKTIQNRRIIITVRYNLNYKKQVEMLYFSLDDGQGKTKIVGKLSFVAEVDKVNHQRRDHLYQKFGFSITDGRISLDKIPVAMLVKERDK